MLGSREWNGHSSYFARPVGQIAKESVKSLLEEGIEMHYAIWLTVVTNSTYSYEMNDVLYFMMMMSDESGSVRTHDGISY